MNKFLIASVIILLLVFTFGCQPASVTGLKKTDEILKANSYHDVEQDKKIAKLHDAVFGVQPDVTEPLIENGEKIYDAADNNTKEYKGIFTWKGFLGGLLTTLEKVKDGLGIVAEVAGANPYTTVITGAIGLAIAGLTKVVLDRGKTIATKEEEHKEEVAKLERKVEIVALQEPVDTAKYKAIEAKVDAKLAGQA